MRPDIGPGAIFPDYDLSGHTTKRRKLSELQGQHPMVLVLSRGAFTSREMWKPGLDTTLACSELLDGIHTGQDR
jgi:peroxiredoxin